MVWVQGWDEIMDHLIYKTNLFHYKYPLKEPQLQPLNETAEKINNLCY